MTNRVALMHANGELADQLAQAVNEHTNWHADPYSAVVDEEGRRQKLSRMRSVMAGNYDLIQADELVGNGPAAQVLSTLTNTPVCGYLRGWGDYTNDHGQYGRKLATKLRLKTSVLTRTMDGMAAISNAVLAGMHDMYPVTGANVVERPYNVQYYASGDDRHFRDAGPTVLTVTNLRYKEKYDGVTTILEGLKPLFDERPDLTYAIAGGGRHLSALENYVQDYPHSDRVSVLGFREDVPELLASADLFCYVSFLDGAPSTVYEAQSAGLPVIGGDAAGVPEAVGDAGAVVPPTPHGIYDGIDECLANPDYRHDLARASKQKMAMHNERVAQDWVDYWRGCL